MVFMRFVALIVVIAIIYVVMSHHATHSSDVKEAISMVDENVPKPSTSATAPVQGGAPAQSDYRAAMDRAHSVVDLVHKQQKGE